MKNHFQIFFLLLVLFSGCKSNPEAYNMAYDRLKQKEKSLVDTNAKPAMDVPKKVLSKDSSDIYKSEPVKLILGDEANLSVFSIVSKSFINRTNARGYYSQMLDKGYPAVLVQNEQMMFRIIVGSFEGKDQAEHKLKELKTVFPEAYILIRMK
ncbi:MAG: SPOR domain-containing protein [Bacteroidales bacterium]|nr:SPOR domain-containing protein [Bacteroidales bacterium]